jgi:uncharacterized phage protein (TIGR02220 family)
MINLKELGNIARDYANYFFAVKTTLKQEPMSFEEWYENFKANSSLETEKIVSRVIVELNNTLKMFGKNGYKNWGKTTRSPIRQRIKEGFTELDFIKVIKVKSEWLADSSMHKYYRPKTLFGNKFESYLNEDVKPIEITKQNEYTDAIRIAATDNY